MFKRRQKEPVEGTDSTNAAPPKLKRSATVPLEPHRVETISTLEEFEQLLQDHHYRHVVIFCLTSTQKDPDVDEDGWYHHYERLNNIHFVKAQLDQSKELEERLQPKVRPSWITFHKGHATGWSSGGMKRFRQTHSEKKSSN